MTASQIGLTLFVLLIGAALVALPYVLRSLPAFPPNSRLGRIERAWVQLRTWLNVRFRYTDLGGYVHDTAMSQWIFFTQVGNSAGTWTPTYSSGKMYSRRTAADATQNLFIPMVLPSNSAAQKGAYLQSFDVFFNITTAAMDDFATVELWKEVLSSVGAHTATAVTITIDSANDTAAERKATGEHKMTCTLSTPAWVDNDEAYMAYCVLDHAATSVFDLVGARANYTLRL